jgi:hypothetical protein
MASAKRKNNEVAINLEDERNGDHIDDNTEKSLQDEVKKNLQKSPDLSAKKPFFLKYIKLNPFKMNEEILMSFISNFSTPQVEAVHTKETRGS